MRSVLYEGSMSELFVPYMDPGESWATRVFIDAGEFFPGGVLRSMQAGVDCPANAEYIDDFSTNEQGIPMARPRMACLFENVSGSPAWRHFESEQVWGRPNRTLVLRTAAVVGNYDYLLDWRFEQDGSIHVAVGATGVLEVKPVKEKTVDGPVSDDLMGKDEKGNPLEFGQLVAPGVDGVDHDHFFCYRLDL